MKKVIIALFMIVTIIGSYLLYKSYETVDDKQEGHHVLQTVDSALPTEQFIMKHLFNNEGLIQTNFHGMDEGNIALSESIGLWMEYLVEKADEKLFHEAFQTVQNSFLSKDYLVAWRIDDGEVATTNALIDDLRIIEALFLMGEKLNKNEYIETAQMMASAVMKYNQQGQMFVDFYDSLYKYTNDQLTISYLIPGALAYMDQYGMISNDAQQKLYAFINDMPIQNGFYPKYYEVKQQTFYYDDTINLIDQLYVAIHMERFGENTDEFYEWIESEFYKNNILYGRYDSLTKERAVEYEAAAVYALAIIYALEKEQFTFAKDLYQQMITLQVMDADSDYYGGYMDLSDVTTHPFDNLLPLLAERKLRNEQIIN